MCSSDLRLLSRLHPEKESAYFIAWIDRLIDEAKTNTDWNTEGEKTAVLNLLSYARNIYRNLQK